MIKWIITSLCTIVVLIVFIVGLLWSTERTIKLEEGKIREVYGKLIAQTGQSQDRLPFIIIDDSTINAYNDGTKVVLYTGMIKEMKNYDEIALVLGHEIAHGMLGHLGKLNTPIAEEVSVLEANADKMGALYALKAGYNVCKGREYWKRIYLEKGNYQGSNHPNYSYRYDELNIGCNN